MPVGFKIKKSMLIAPCGLEPQTPGGPTPVKGCMSRPNWDSEVK